MRFEEFTGELDAPDASAYALFTGDLDPVGVDAGVNVGGGRGVVSPPMAADLPKRAASMPLPAGYLPFDGELDRVPDDRMNAGAERGSADDPRSLLRKQAPVPQNPRPIQPAPLPQRSWGEAFSDATKSVAQGLLDVASLPGVAYSAATSDFDTAYLNAIRGTQEVLQDEKSPALQAGAQALQQKLATAEGWREKLAVAGWETLTDPALLGDAVVRSGPGMLAGGLFGRAAGSAVDAAGNALLGRTIATGSEAAARSAVALKNAAPVVASGSAVGVSAAQQGASVANELYAELQKLPTSVFAAEPEFQQLAREHGEDKARSILAAAAANRALLVGTGASVLSMKLVPGGDAIEKMFLPSHLKGTAREAVKSTSFMTRPLTRGMEGSLGSQALEVLLQRPRSAGAESFSEGAEEASGAVAKGLELSRAGQDVKLDEMAGEAAGQGMAVGGVMGGTAGARGAGAAPRVLEQSTRPTVPPELPTARGQRGTQPHTAGGPASPPPPSPPSPSADLSAAPIEHSYAYSGGMLPGSGATWSEVAAADRKAQAEAEILRQAEALPAQDAPTDADAGQAAPSTAASTSADADPSAAQAEEQGAARHTAAAQVPMQVQALDSGMLVVRGDQAAIQSRLQAGGVGGARSFSGVTVVPVEQAALARRVLSAPPVEPIRRQVGGVPARALTAANAAQEAASLQGAQQAPAVHRGELAASGTSAGARTAGISAAGTAVSPSSQGPQAGPQASAADVRALPPAPVQMEPLRDGTLMVRGDAKDIRARLRAGGVDRVIERKGGLMVGLDQVQQARRILQATQPQASAGPALPARQFSRSAGTKTGYEARIDALFADGKATTGTCVLDRSDIMGLLGYPDVPLMLNERHLLDGLTNHPEMTAYAWKRVPEWLENPAAVYTDPSHPGRLTVIGPERLAGYPVVMAVEPKAGNPVRGKDGAVPQEQLLVTVFAKTTGDLQPLASLANQGRLLYADTKKAPVVWQRAGEIPRAGGQSSGAKRILTEKHLAGYRRAQGQGSGVRPSAYTSQGLPLQPATVQSVRAAVAKLTNSMGLLAGGRGRVVATTSDEIKEHWEPLIGEVDTGSQDTGLAHGFYDPETKTVFLIADHIEAGQEMAVAAHELMHKHGKAVLGERGWRQLHEVIGTWVGRPDGSLERQVYDEAVRRVDASRPAGADAASYSSEELFPYAVQVAMELGVEPTAMRPITSVQGWLARVRAAMRGAWDRLTNRPELFDSQDLVDLGFAVAQRENPAYASEFDEPSAPVSPGSGITAQQMQRIVDKVLEGLGMRGMVTPTIMQNPTAGSLVAPESMPSGGVSGGRLNLFLEGIRDEVEGFRVVFHELFHLGLSQSVTSQEYRQTMLHLLADPQVRRYAARWKLSLDGQSRRGSMPANNWHALAVEEALADISEEIHHGRRGIGTREMAGWVRRTIAWIADLAHQWGMPKVSRRLRGMTLTQAEAFVVGTVLKARTGAPVLLRDARWATSREEKAPGFGNELHNAATAAGNRQMLAITQAANLLVESLRTTGALPPNFVTKQQAVQLGWQPGKALAKYLPNGQIGGDEFLNTTGGVPSIDGRIWYEADVGLIPTRKRASQPGTRLLYSSDGLLYISPDHYETVYPIGQWRR